MSRLKYGGAKGVRIDQDTAWGDYGGIVSTSVEGTWECENVGWDWVNAEYWVWGESSSDHEFCLYYDGDICWPLYDFGWDGNVWGPAK